MSTFAGFVMGIFSHPPIQQPINPLPVLYPMGTVIVCPHCCKTVAYAKRDIFSGEVMRSNAWESDIDLLGAEMICPNDGTPYLRDGKLHTIGGWK